MIRGHLHPGASPCPECAGLMSGERGLGFGAYDPYDADRVFWQILEQRWSRREGESDEEWRSRAYREFEAGLWDPSADRVHYARLPVFEGLEERPRTESLEGLAKAGQRRPGPSPGEVPGPVRRALSSGDG